VLRQEFIALFGVVVFQCLEVLLMHQFLSKPDALVEELQEEH